MESNFKFQMHKTQADFLRKRYSEVATVQKILAAGAEITSDDEDLTFEVPVDLFNAFWDWLEDESVFTLDKDDEPTDDTYSIEGIIDYLHYQDKGY